MTPQTTKTAVKNVETGPPNTRMLWLAKVDTLHPRAAPTTPAAATDGSTPRNSRGRYVWILVVTRMDGIVDRHCQVRRATKAKPDRVWIIAAARTNAQDFSLLEMIDAASIKIKAAEAKLNRVIVVPRTKDATSLAITMILSPPPGDPRHGIDRFLG